jgi:hypothetical protein
MSEKGSKPMRLDRSWRRRLARGVPQREGRVPKPDLPEHDDPESMRRGGIPVFDSEQWQSWRPWRRR